MNKAAYYSKLAGQLATVALVAHVVSGAALSTGREVYTYVANHPANVHDVSDPEDRAFADRVRAAAPLQDWVMDSTIIDQAKFSCAIWDKVPEMTLERHFELHRAIMFGADQAFNYMSYEGTKINCPQYLYKFPENFDYRAVKTETETYVG